LVPFWELHEPPHIVCVFDCHLYRIDLYVLLAACFFATLASLPILSANSSTSASPTSIALPHLHDTVWIRLLSLDSLRLLLLHGIWLSDTADVPAPDLHRLMNTARFDLPKPS
jgi:hypothetical protein